jgi:predicted transposase/invertase (TIGR01784 family)
MQTYDKLWKGIIEDLVVDFLHYFFPTLCEEIDFSKGIEFLDQELIKLFPEADGDNRYVDKLLKVHLKNGTTKWILIHIEVQGYKDGTFSFRMFTYFYRILDRYQQNIIALAIFTDKYEDFHPKSYEYDYYGTTLNYGFNTYKVLEQKEADLVASENPFALVILATQKAILKGKLDDEALKKIKWDIARLMYDRNYDKSKIQALFFFINRYIRFANEQNYAIFAEEFLSVHENTQKNMGVIDILIEDAKIEGIEKNQKEANRKFATSLIQSTDFDNAKIAMLVGVSEEYVANLRAELRN